MWDTYNEDKVPHSDIGRIVRIAVFAAIGAILFGLAGNQAVNLLMNVEEGGELFTKPLIFSIISGMILSSIMFVRVNPACRHSITWYGIKILMNLLKRGDYEFPWKILRYSDFQMGRVSFALWQLTKVVLFAPVFSNILFGMTVVYSIQGNDIGLGSIGNIFSIPFDDLSSDSRYAQQKVIPMMPALTLLIPPLLTAVGLRLVLYVGFTSSVDIISQYAADSREGKPKFLSYVSIIEIVAGVAILWIGFNMFFSANIDYNTRYAISGVMTFGAAFISYGFIDRRRAKVMIYPAKTFLYSRVFTGVVVFGLVGSIVLVNGSIGDARKIELNVPYISQQIEVNRYMHDLENVEINNYDVSPPSVYPSAIASTVDRNRDILDNIRLWDEIDARSRLDEQLGPRSDLGFSGFHLLRFNDRMYWTGTTTPVIPSNIDSKEIWFDQHFIYTHPEPGMKMLEANNGNVVDESSFFTQRRIYYGESSNSGLNRPYWSAYPLEGTRSQEVGGIFYNGTGGVDIAPPLSWMFEPNFMLSDPGTTVHVMRYKDIHERMGLFFPYFVYDFCFDCTTNNSQPKQVESFVVTDGAKTYWLMPLIVAINTSNVPWSSTGPSSVMLKLVGYSLIDAYDGTIRTIVTGDDFFSKLFEQEYKSLGATRSTPDWLGDQIRYPDEMFIWRVSKFNTYHVADAKSYIEAKNFYEFTDDSDKLSAVYAFAKPPGFQNSEFVGMHTLELKEPHSDNLVGYITVSNDLKDLGRMRFYSLPINSTIKFIDPAFAKTVLTGNAEYKKYISAVSNPLLGEILLYKVGDYEVYFISIFADAALRHVSLVATVGAVSENGTFQVGLGSTAAKSFENYLQKLSAGVPTAQPQLNNETFSDMQIKIQKLERLFTDAGLTIIKPTAISSPLEFREGQAVYRVDSDLTGAEATIHTFIQDFGRNRDRVFEWQNGNTVNFGVLVQIEGIVESHYVSIEMG